MSPIDDSLSDFVHSPKIPTASLFGYLLTVLAWEVEFGALHLHAFTDRKLDPIGHIALLIASLLFTTFAWIRGKRDFRWLKHTGGRVAITGGQAVLVTLFMIGFGCLFAWVVERLVNH